MSQEEADAALAQLMHDLRQPLNVIRLTGGNIRSRLLPLLDEEAGAYLIAKLDRIEDQTQRAARLVDQFLKGQSGQD